jgi:hypothetical protein
MTPPIPVTKGCTEASLYLMLSVEGVPSFYCTNRAAAEKSELEFIQIPHEANYVPSIQ